jgi:hypothetical protein
MGKKAEGQATENEDVVLGDESGIGAVDNGQGTEGEGNLNAAAADDDQGAEGVDDDSVVVTIGEEPPPQDEHAQAPEWVRELRKKNREDQRRIRELEEQLKTKGQAETKPAALGKKPALEDYDYDTERFEQELTAWHDRKRQHDETTTKARDAEEAAQAAWKKKLESYGSAKTELKVKDFDDAEAALQDHLNVTQQGIIVQGAENPALLVYALGKNPKKAKELGSITDPVKFAFAVAKLETQLKVTNRKAPPPPEKTVQGTGGSSGSVDSTLARLRTEAEKTGDYTKVTAYKRQKRQSDK